MRKERNAVHDVGRVKPNDHLLQQRESRTAFHPAHVDEGQDEERCQVLKVATLEADKDVHDAAVVNSRDIVRYGLPVQPGGSVRGERANFTRPALGCIEAKFCK